jgi:serine/threonine protein kinase
VSFPEDGVLSDGYRSHAAAGSASGGTTADVVTGGTVESGEAAGAGAGRVDVFVSHAAADREWAEWIGWELEDAGHRVLVLAWEATAGSHRTAAVHEGVCRATRTLVVVSGACLRSAVDSQPWRAVFSADPDGSARRLLPVRIEACRRPLLLSQVVSIDLFDLTEGEARRSLLEGVRAARVGRSKPVVAPRFPRPRRAPAGTATAGGPVDAVGARAAFPGRPALPRFAAPLGSGDPRMIGEYTVRGRLGSGGMGTVYLGEAASGAWVAVKTVNADLAREERLRSRFAREAANARRFASPYTPAVLDDGASHDPPYLVTEFVDGPTLSREVAERGPLPGSELCRLALSLLGAIVALHDAGIVHRDVKPSNVILSRAGPRVIDLGISRALDDLVELTMRGERVGTPALMAPEQWRGDPVPASDVFAWAGVVVFAATGRWAFPGETSAELRRAVLDGDPRLDGLEPPLRTLVESAFRKDPAARPSPRELYAALSGRVQPAPSPPGSSPPGEPPSATPPGGDGAGADAGGQVGVAGPPRRTRVSRGFRTLRETRAVPTATPAALLVGLVAGLAVAWIDPAGLAVALPFPLLPLAGVYWDVRAFRRAVASSRQAPADPGALADALAGRMRDETRRANGGEIRSGPDGLPIDWSVTAASRGLSESWSAILRRAEQAAYRPTGFAGFVRHGTPARGFSDLAGQDDLLPVLFRVPTRRLVVLGGAGGGKTTLARAMLRRLLAERDRGDPVPVIVHAGGWDPGRGSAQDAVRRWFASSLVRRFPHLADRSGAPSAPARALADSGRILPIIDGLDEVPAARRTEIIRSVGGAWPMGCPLVLLCSTDAYRAAVRPAGEEPVPLAGAAAVEITPLAAADVTDWFALGAWRRAAADPAGGRGPRAAADAVAAELAHRPGGALARALRTPRMADLARARYVTAPEAGTDPRRAVDELRDRTRFPDRRAVESHLLSGPASAAGGGNDTGRPGGRGPLAWWELDVLVPRAIPPALLALAVGVTSGLAAGIPAFGAALGAASGLASDRLFCPRRSWPSGRCETVRREFAAAAAGAIAAAAAVGIVAGALLFLAVSATAALGTTTAVFRHDDDAVGSLVAYAGHTGRAVAVFGVAAGLWWWWTSAAGRYAVARTWMVLTGGRGDGPNRPPRRPRPVFDPARLPRPVRAARIGLAVLVLSGPPAFFIAHAAGHEDACDAMQGRAHRALELYATAQWEVVRERDIQGRLMHLRFAPVEGCVWANPENVQPGDTAWMERVGVDRDGLPRSGEKPRVFGWKAIVNHGTFLRSYPLPPGTAFRLCLHPEDTAEDFHECTDYFGRPAGWTYANLLRDSGFEDQVAGRPPAPPWESRGTADVSVKEGGFRGANTLRIVFDDGPAAPRWNDVRQTVRVEAGGSYVLRAFVAPGAGLRHGCVGVRDARTGELRAASVFEVDEEDVGSFHKAAVSITAGRTEDLVAFVGALAPGVGAEIGIDQVTFTPDPLDAWERRAVAAMASVTDPSTPAEQAQYCGG